MKPGNFQNLAIAVVALFALGTLAACGGGGGSSSSSTGGTATTALSVAESVSVVEVNSTGTATVKPSSLSIDFGAVAQKMSSGDTSMVRFAYSDAGTDYTNQAQSAYTYEPSSEVMSQANFLLCVMGQTGYDESTLLNAGNYVALVDSSKCEKGGNKSTNASGSQSQSLATWVVNSSRASDTADQIVKVWADENTGGSTTRFFVRTVISEAATTTNPYGTFTMQFGGRTVSPTDGSVGTTLTDSGFLSVGETGVAANQIRFDLSMTSNSGDPTRDGTIAGIMISDLDAATGDSTTGRAYIAMTLGTNTSGTPDVEYDVAYDTAVALLKDISNNQVCLSKSSYREAVWRYALFYDGAQTVNSVAKVDGEAVAMNSGFPFTVTTSSGSTEYGYVGYWGVFMPNGAAVTDGTTVTRETFGTGTGATYTIVKAPGKLIKFTKQEATATALDGVEISYWDNAASKQIKLVWDNANTRFNQTAVWNNTGSFGGYWDSSGGTSAYTLTANNMYFMYSEQLGGDVMFETDGSAAIVNIGSTTSGSMPFRYNLQEVVSAKSTAPTTLYCLTQCLQGGFATMDGSSEYLTDKTDPNAAAYLYTYDQSTMALTYSGNSTAVSFTGSSGSGGNGWGTRSGPMVTTNPTTLGLTSVYDLFDQSVFYQWETGPNSWNTYTAVKDSSNVLQTFDKPLAMNYSHTTAQDRNGDTTYDGKKYLLEYGGFGDLWGIPWAGEGDATAEEQRWYPLFALKDGTRMTDSDGIKYVVKALDIERKPNTAASGSCSALNVGSASRPGAGTVTFDDPGDSSLTNYIGTRPDPDPLDVKMVDGVLQS